MAGDKGLKSNTISDTIRVKMETKIKPSTGEHRISTRGKVFCGFQTGICDFPGIYLNILQDRKVLGSNDALFIKRHLE